MVEVGGIEPPSVAVRTSGVHPSNYPSHPRRVGRGSPLYFKPHMDPLPVLLANALSSFVGSRCPNMTRSHQTIILPREQTPKRLVSLQGFQGVGLRRSVPVKVSEKFANLNAQTLDLSVAGVIVKITHSFIFLERGQSQRPASPK